MQRSLIPIILASLGFTLFVASNAMPLFDWKIDVIVSDFPHTYSVQINLPPWITTRLGESLEKSSHIFREIKVSDGENVCTNIESFGLNIARSSQEKFLRVYFVIDHSVVFFRWFYRDRTFWGLYMVGHAIGRARFNIQRYCSNHDRSWSFGCSVFTGYHDGAI